MHGYLTQQVIGISGAAPVEIDGDLLGCGGPEAEGGLLGCPGGAQIIS